MKQSITGCQRLPQHGQKRSYRLFAESSGEWFFQSTRPIGENGFDEGALGRGYYRRHWFKPAKLELGE
ncbi:MAG TPA: hypothetical protein VE685_15275 [Thermoanaerobaculia bacterium]|nr:hypothetical protein [Thermoanaerobaculia bacterium]